MYMAEDQNKVQNIVGAQLGHFRTLYKPIIGSLKVGRGFSIIWTFNKAFRHVEFLYQT